MIKSKKFQLESDFGDAVEIEITQFKAGEGTDLLLKVIQPAAQAFGGLIGTFNAETDSLGDLGPVLAEAVQQITRHGDDGKLLRKLVSMVTRRVGDDAPWQPMAKKERFDVAYAGNYGELLETVALVIEFNYGRALVALGKRMGGVRLTGGGLLSRLQGVGSKPSSSEPKSRG